MYVERSQHLRVLLFLSYAESKNQEEFIQILNLTGLQKDMITVLFFSIVFVAKNTRALLKVAFHPCVNNTCLCFD